MNERWKEKEHLGRDCKKKKSVNDRSDPNKVINAIEVNGSSTDSTVAIFTSLEVVF